MLTGLPVAALAVLGWSHRWMSDDGLINVRVVQNIFAGHGPVFNVGERVEVSTSTAWLAALSVGHAVVPFAPIEYVAVVAGVVATLLGLAAASAGCAAYWRASGRQGLLVPAGSLVVLALPPFWDFATSGLETGLAFLWIGGTFWLLARRHARTSAGGPELPAWRPLWPAFAVGLGPLVRPDFALLAAPFGLALLLLSRRDGRSWLGGIAAAAAVPVSYELFRMGYYASLVPNTALAKTAGTALWHRGEIYLDDFAGRYTLVAPLVALLALTWLPALVSRIRQSDIGGVALLAAPVAGGVLHALYVVAIGGDFMHARLLLPAAFSLLVPVAVVALPSAAVGMRLAALLPLAVVVPWGVHESISVRNPEARIGPHGIANERAFYRHFSGRNHPVTVGDFAGFRFDGLAWERDGQARRAQAATGDRMLLDRRGRPLGSSAQGYGLVALSDNIGMFGVAAGPGVFVGDLLTLAEPVGARIAVPTLARDRPGHPKEMPMTWVLARYAVPEPDDPADVRAARAALQCGALAEMESAITAPITPGRFVANIGAAVRFTRLSVPSDPRVAEARFCRR